MQETLSVMLYALGMLEKDNSVLLLYRHNTPLFNMSYSLPGGKIEIDESPLQALSRELEEELGIKVTGQAPLSHVMYFKGITQPCVVFVFSIHEWLGEPFNKEPHKHSHYAWYPLEHLPLDIVPRHGRIISHIQKQLWYSEELNKE